MIAQTLCGDGQYPPALDNRPEMLELVDAYLVYRSGGCPPWALGHDMPRRRFYEAATILSRWFEIIPMLRQRQGNCPLLDALGG